MKGQPCEAGSEQLHVEEQLSVLNEPNLPNHLQVIADSGIEEVNMPTWLTQMAMKTSVSNYVQHL